MNAFENHPFYFYIGKDEQGVRDLEEYGELYKKHLLQITPSAALARKIP
jgi:hypothetical protein